MPRALRIIDDRILVGAGSVVAVIDAPASPDAPSLPPGVPGLSLPKPEGVPPVPVPMETPDPEAAVDSPQ
jgi:hypothetical protein